MDSGTTIMHTYREKDRNKRTKNNFILVMMTKYFGKYFRKEDVDEGKSRYERSVKIKISLELILTNDHDQ